MDENRIPMSSMAASEGSLGGYAATPSKSQMVRTRNCLKVKRWESGLKQYELAFMLGCSAPYLSMVENNRVEATKEFKARAAAIFEVPVQELFPGEE